MYHHFYIPYFLKLKSFLEQSGENTPYYPSLIKKTKLDSFLRAGRSPKGKHVFHITSGISDVFTSLQY